MENKLIEKIIPRSVLRKWDQVFSEYFYQMLEKNEESWICELPAREYTESMIDPATGDLIIRFKLKENK